MQSSYTLLPRLRTPSIDPGSKIEIEVYMTGYGPVEKNKLYISYASPKLISSKNPGTLVYCIKVKKDSRTGRIVQPVSGEKHREAHPCDQTGVLVVLNEGYFQDIPGKTFPQDALPPIMPEHSWDGIPPLLLTLNTSKEAPPGDYTIFITFTYSSGKEIQTDRSEVTIHVKSPAERHWKKATVTVIALTIIGLLIANLSSVENLIRNIFTFSGESLMTTSQTLVILGLISEFVSVAITVWTLFFGYYKRLEKKTNRQQEKYDKIKGSLILIFLIIGMVLQGAAVLI